MPKWLKLLALCFGGTGFAGSDPGRRPTPLIIHAVEASRVQNRGILAWMLAQGKSSSRKTKKNKKPQSKTHHTILLFAS